MLFGHQNDAAKPADNTTNTAPMVDSVAPASAPAVGQNPLAVDPATGVSLPSVPDAPAPARTAAPDTPSPDNAPDSTPSEPTRESDQPTPAAAPAPASGTDNAAAAPANNDLLDLKQQALQQLSPLVDHLDQTPEEKFRTTMMLIQSSDNQALIPTAYEAAQKITDDKARAQALLDIVNEINYFTHQGQDQADQ